MRGLGIAWRKEGAVRGGWEEEQRMGGEECEGLGPLSCSGKAAAAPGEMLLELIMALAAVPSPGGGCWQRKEITFTGIWNKCSSSGGNNSTHLPPQSPHVPASPPCPHSCVPQILLHGSLRLRTTMLSLPSFCSPARSQASPLSLWKACLLVSKGGGGLFCVVQRSENRLMLNPLP